VDKDIEEMKREEEERQQRKYGKYFKEKVLEAEEEDYDPSQVSFNLKRKRLTVREEEQLRLEQEEKARIKEEEENVRNKERAEGNQGWTTSEVKVEPMLDFGDDPPSASVKNEEDDAETKPKAEAEADVKPEVRAASGGFKKRKMHGAAAVRHK
jgi:hypothetical protein